MGLSLPRGRPVHGRWPSDAGELPLARGRPDAGRPASARAARSPSAAGTRALSIPDDRLEAASGTAAGRSSGRRSSNAIRAPMRRYAAGGTRKRPVRFHGRRRLRGDGVARPVRIRLDRLRTRGAAGLRGAGPRPSARVPAAGARSTAARSSSALRSRCCPGCGAAAASPCIGWSLCRACWPRPRSGCGSWLGCARKGAARSRVA